MPWGLISRQVRWGLTARGWLLVGVIALGAGVAVTVRIYPFLALTDRTTADLLVVEGWVHDHAIRAAVDEFRAGDYHDVFTTGGPVHGVGAYINEFSTAASIGAQRLKGHGLPAERVHMAPARTSDRDRTYSSAVALRDCLNAHRFTVTQINVVTEDLHARRTRLLFQKAFGPGVAVGVIAVPNPDYDSKRWWACSEGVRDVLSESISYLYARFFFFPPARTAGGAPLHAKS